MPESVTMVRVVALNPPAAGQVIAGKLPGSELNVLHHSPGKKPTWRAPVGPGPVLGGSPG